MDFNRERLPFQPNPNPLGTYPYNMSISSATASNVDDEESSGRMTPSQAQESTRLLSRGQLVEVLSLALDLVEDMDLLDEDVDDEN